MVSRETILDGFFTQEGEKAIRYAEILATWGIERGLIGPREGDRIWDRHIANCLPVTTLIPSGASLVDIGSGAGLPGLVIAIARPDLSVTLIEPLERRVNFLNEVISELDLKVATIRGKSESVKARFDVVTARAVAPMPKLIDISWHLVGNLLLAMKGAAAEEELAQVKLPKGAKAEIIDIELPEITTGRVVRVEKHG
jgi:16S rRNA (guanine527-N7)-methyltransferase